MLERFSVTIPTVDLTDSITTTEEIKFGIYTGGFVLIPTVAGADITSLTWWVAEKAGGTFLPASDEDGTAIVQTVAKTKAYAIPAAIFGAAAAKIVVNAAGTVAMCLKA
jgi:hypothetical protein